MQPQLPPDFIEDYKRMKRRLELVEKALTNDAVQVGTELFWPAAAGELPFNYHIEDGSALDRIGFAALFQLIGTDYGTGDGITSFNIPNRTGAKVFIPEPLVWTNFSFAAGFSNYGGGFASCGYAKDALGIVHLRGLTAFSPTGSYGAGSNGVTMPAGYRPASNAIFIVQASSTGNYLQRLDINSDGTVIRSPIGGGNWDGAYLSYEGVTFDSGTVPTTTLDESGTWVIKTL